MVVCKQRSECSDERLGFPRPRPLKTITAHHITSYPHYIKLLCRAHRTVKHLTTDCVINADWPFQNKVLKIVCIWKLTWFQCWYQNEKWFRYNLFWFDREKHFQICLRFFSNFFLLLFKYIFGSLRRKECEESKEKEKCENDRKKMWRNKKSDTEKSLKERVKQWERFKRKRVSKGRF